MKGEKKKAGTCGEFQDIFRGFKFVSSADNEGGLRGERGFRSCSFFFSSLRKVLKSSSERFRWCERGVVPKTNIYVRSSFKIFFPRTITVQVARLLSSFFFLSFVCLFPFGDKLDVVYCKVFYYYFSITLLLASVFFFFGFPFSFV